MFVPVIRYRVIDRPNRTLWFLFIVMIVEASRGDSGDEPMLIPDLEVVAQNLDHTSRLEVSIPATIAT